MTSRTRAPAARRDPATSAPDVTPVVEIIAARQGEHSYPVHVGRGAARALAPLLQGVDRVAIVTSRRVLRTPIGAEVAGWLQGGEPLAITHLLADGEKGKTLAELERAAVRSPTRPGSWPPPTCAASPGSRSPPRCSPWWTRASAARPA